MSAPEQDSQRRQGRQALFVIIGATVGWVGLNLVGGALGMDPRYAFLADFAALAAFFWAFIVMLRLWLRRTK
ncbi:MAG: DUF5337 family protein [Pseudomonadota bacterium]